MLRLAAAFGVVALVYLLAPTYETQFFTPTMPTSLRGAQQVNMGPAYVAEPETRFAAPAQSWDGVFAYGLVGFAGTVALLAVTGKKAPEQSSRAGDAEMSGAIASKKVWIDFAKKGECKPGTVVSGFQYGQEIAIACDRGGKLYAMSNKMPPTGQPATFGTLPGDGTIIEPVSGTKFNMNNGKPVGKWCPSLVGNIIGLITAPSDLIMYPCRVRGNSVQCLINVNAKLQFESNYWRGVLDAQGKVDGGYY